MEHIQVTNYWNEIWSILAMMLLVGPVRVLIDYYGIREWLHQLHPVAEINVRGILALVVEYILVLQICIFAFGDIFSNVFELLAVSIVVFYCLMIWLAWRHGLQDAEIQHKTYFRLFEINLKEVFSYCFDYYIVLQVVKILLGDFFQIEGEIVITLLLMFAIWFADVTWSVLREEKKELIRYFFRWLGVLFFLYWVTKERFGITSTDKLIEHSDIVYIWIKNAGIACFGHLEHFLFRVQMFFGKPVGIFAAMLLPIYSLVILYKRTNIDIIITNLCSLRLLPAISRLLYFLFSLEIKANFNFRIFKPVFVYFNYVVYLFPEEAVLRLKKSVYSLLSFQWELIIVVSSMYWLFHRQITHAWHLSFFLYFVSSSVAVYCARRTWSSASDDFRKWLKRAMNLILVMVVIIAIFQIIWNIHFFAAARILFQRVVVGAFSFFRKSAFSRLVASRWKWLLGQATRKGLQEGAVFLLRKFTLRFAIKVAMICLTYQIFTFKPVKRFVRKHAGEAGEAVVKKVNQGKDKWHHEKFIVKLLIFSIIMYLLWISPWQILWPMLPKGTATYISKAFFALIKLFVMALKKLFGNKTVDFLMIFMAKRLSGRIARFSPAMKHKFKMFMVWKLGRIMIENRNKFFFLDKTVRDANRRARQEAIDNLKAYKDGDIGFAHMTGKTVFDATKVATDLAMDGTIGVANFALKGATTSFSFAQKKSIMFFMSFQAFLKELIRIDRAPKWEVLQKHLLHMFDISKQKEAVQATA